LDAYTVLLLGALPPLISSGGVGLGEQECESMARLGFNLNSSSSLAAQAQIRSRALFQDLLNPGTLRGLQGWVPLQGFEWQLQQGLGEAGGG
jgi:hypothetical protein